MEPVLPPVPTPLPGGPLVPWVLWGVVVVGIVVALAEWPKRWFLKPTKAWKAAAQREKVLMLSPILAAFGALIGGPVFHAADLVERWGLAYALGAGVGVFSWALYDVVLVSVALVPKIVRKKAGLETTEMNAVEGTEPAEVDGTSTAGADGGEGTKP